MSRSLLFVAALVGLGMWVTAPLLLAEGDPKRPNILVIVSDDQRAAGTLGPMDATRRIFARGGTKFTNGVATTPLCCPSRASILTGRYVHNHGVVDNYTSNNLDVATTMQFNLQRAGYRTAMVGKYLNGWSSDPPNFDHWSSFMPPMAYNNAMVNVDGVVGRIDEYSTSFTETRAMAYLNLFENSDDTPWFLYVAPYAPHGPAIPEEAYRDDLGPSWIPNPAAREADLTDKPPYVRAMQAERDKVERFRVRQRQTLMSVDDLVEDIFDRLEALGEADNTLAVYMSDNGYMWYEHGLRSKRYPYDEVVRIPYLVRWPGKVARGVTDKKVVANIDIAPTVYAAAGVRPGYRVDGKNLLESDRRYIYLEFFHDSIEPLIPRWHSIWRPGSTYIRYMGVDRSSREYYAADDPWQLTNVYRDGIHGNAPSNEEVLDRRLRQGKSCAGSTCP